MYPVLLPVPVTILPVPRPFDQSHASEEEQLTSLCSLTCPVPTTPVTGCDMSLTAASSRPPGKVESTGVRQRELSQNISGGFKSVNSRGWEYFQHVITFVDELNISQGWSCSGPCAKCKLYLRKKDGGWLEVNVKQSNDALKIMTIFGFDYNELWTYLDYHTGTMFTEPCTLGRGCLRCDRQN